MLRRESDINPKDVLPDGSEISENLSGSYHSGTASTGCESHLSQHRFRARRQTLGELIPGWGNTDARSRCHLGRGTYGCSMLAAGSFAGLGHSNTGRVLPAAEGGVAGYFLSCCRADCRISNTDRLWTRRVGMTLIGLLRRVAQKAGAGWQRLCGQGSKATGFVRPAQFYPYVSGLCQRHRPTLPAIAQPLCACFGPQRPVGRAAHLCHDVLQYVSRGRHRGLTILWPRYLRPNCAQRFG